MQNIANAKDERILKERIANSRGTICVPFETLDFLCSHPDDPYQIVKKALIKEFKKGCYRLNPSHYIPAIVNNDDLNYILGVLALSSEQLLAKEKPPSPLLRQGFRIQCLQGCHRVAAAKEALPPSERWWTVSLYSAGAGPELRTALAEEYSNLVSYSDSEIYTMICFCNKLTGKLALDASERWWLYLTPNKRRDLGEFFKHRELAAYFEELLDLPGLWWGDWIGNLHEIIGMRCDERIIHYLRHIHLTWLAILGKNKDLMKLIDRPTVKALELRAPSACRDDIRYLEDLFNDHALFAAITNEQQRRDIWTNLITIRGLIPTLHSFFEDVKYLRPLTKVMKGLLRNPSQRKSFKGTIDTALTDHFSKKTQNEGFLKLQRSDAKFTAVRGNAADQVQFGNLMLWLYSARYWPQMIEECPKAEKGGKRLIPTEPDEATWYAFAALALQLGYDSDRIRELTAKKPSKKFQPIIVDPEARPIFTTSGSGESHERRWGRVFQNSYAIDRQFLFLDMLYDRNRGIGKGISSFYVRQSVWFAFFEYILPSQSITNEPNSNPFRPLIDASDSECEISAITAVSSFAADAVQSSHLQQGSAQNDEVDGLRGELHASMQRAASLRQQLEAAREEISALRNENNQLQVPDSQSEVLQKQLEELKSCSVDLQSKLSHLQQTSEEEEATARDTILDLQSRNEALMQDAEKNKIAELKELGLQNEVERLKTANSILEDEKNILEITLALSKDKEKQTDAALSGMAALDNKAQELQTKYEAIQADLEAKTTKCKVMEEALYTQKARQYDTDELNQQLEKYRAKIDTLEADKMSLVKTVDSLKFEAGLQARLTEQSPNMPTRIRLIHENKKESEEQVRDEEEMARITFSYLQNGIGLFDKLGRMLADDQAFRYGQREPIYLHSIRGRKRKFANDPNAHINVERDTINSGRTKRATRVRLSKNETSK